MKVLVVGASSSINRKFSQLLSEKTGLKIVDYEEVLEGTREVFNLFDVLKRVDKDGDYIKAEKSLAKEILERATDFVLENYPEISSQDEISKSKLFNPDLVIVLDTSNTCNDEEYERYIKDIYPLIQAYKSADENTTVWEIDVENNLEDITSAVTEYIIYMMY